VAPAPDDRPGLARAHRTLAYAMPVLVLAQAALAGQHLFEGSSISLHGVLGELTFALTVVGVVLAVVRRCDAAVFFTAVLLAALAFAQVGLGFVGRETTAAAAWHIPVGVAIFGLTTFQVALVVPRLRGGPQGR
jgi:cytochrome b561